MAFYGSQIIGIIDTISLGGRNSVFHLLLTNFELIAKNVLSVPFQNAKQKTTVLSVDSFLEELVAENAQQEKVLSQKWWDKIMDKTKELSDGGEWFVMDIADAMATIIAITSKHPNDITFIMQDEGKSTLKPSMLSSILANATKRPKVSLQCLDSFFKGGEESQEWKELLSLCLNNEK